MCFDSDDEDIIINYSNDLIDFTRDLVTVPTEAEPTNQVPEPAVIESVTLQSEIVSIIFIVNKSNVRFELQSRPWHAK